MTDREQTRRDAEAEQSLIRERLRMHEQRQRAEQAERELDASSRDQANLATELAVARRERDEALALSEKYRGMWIAQRDKAAKVPALVEAVKLALMHLEDDRAIAAVRLALADWEQE